MIAIGHGVVPSASIPKAVPASTAILVQGGAGGFRGEEPEADDWPVTSLDPAWTIALPSSHALQKG
jgi:hypothetical protein